MQNVEQQPLGLFLTFFFYQFTVLVTLSVTSSAGVYKLIKF